MSEGDFLAALASRHIPRPSGNVDEDAPANDDDASGVDSKHQLPSRPPTVEDWPLWEVPVEVRKVI